MSSKSFPLLTITGPTGVGKTALAMHLADRENLRLISADSVMVYRHLDIGSAKPSPDELTRYPHDLVDCVEPEHAFDAGQFVVAAEAAIEEAWGRGQIPVLVGGTILYLKALLDGLDQLPAASPEIREAIRAEADVHGWPALHAQLGEVDPAAAELIHPNHSSRIERALEVIRLTGHSITSFWTGQHGETRIAGRLVDLSVLALWPADREQLKARLDRRFDDMLAQGLVEEVEGLRARPGLSMDCPSMRSVGYRQVWNYLSGDLEYDMMCDQAKAATRQLAKRQLTWLRSWKQDVSCRLDVGDRLPVSDAESWLERSLSHVL